MKGHQKDKERRTQVAGGDEAEKTQKRQPNEDCNNTSLEADIARFKHEVRLNKFRNRICTQIKVVIFEEITTIFTMLLGLRLIVSSFALLVLTGYVQDTRSMELSRAVSAQSKDEMSILLPEVNDRNWLTLGNKEKSNYAIPENSFMNDPISLGIDGRNSNHLPTENLEFTLLSREPGHQSQQYQSSRLAIRHIKMSQQSYPRIEYQSNPHMDYRHYTHTDQQSYQNMIQQPYPQVSQYLLQPGQQYYPQEINSMSAVPQSQQNHHVQEISYPGAFQQYHNPGKNNADTGMENPYLHKSQGSAFHSNSPGYLVQPISSQHVHSLGPFFKNRASMAKQYDTNGNTHEYSQSSNSKQFNHRNGAQNYGKDLSYSFEHPAQSSLKPDQKKSAEQAWNPKAFQLETQVFDGMRDDPSAQTSKNYEAAMDRNEVFLNNQKNNWKLYIKDSA
ncbi:hypothetical protein BY996DRAFT_6504616 [Phakopsora pachyrhizi]|nr:hypothetical protein BY996DRAFT_6504616 [Phakopsora pachyrhizi]